MQQRPPANKHAFNSNNIFRNRFGSSYQVLDQNIGYIQQFKKCIEKATNALIIQAKSEFIFSFCYCKLPAFNKRCTTSAKLS